MKRLLLPLALAAALTVPVGAQFGWFQLNGGLIARLSSSETAATIRQDGSGAILDLYAGATRVWRATSTGITNSVAALFADGTAAAPSITFASETNKGIYSRSAGTFNVGINGAGVFELQAFGLLALPSTGSFNWSSGITGTGTDLSLIRDAANTLALRNGVNAQSFNIYNTYTDASNFERARLLWGSSTFFIQTTGAGTGSARSIIIESGANAITLRTNAGATQGFQIAGGHFLALADNTYDIGASGGRPRLVYTGSSVVASLPSCAAGSEGARYFVTDANATMSAGIGAIVAGGGANKVPVYCDGTNWRIG